LIGRIAKNSVGAIRESPVIIANHPLLSELAKNIVTLLMDY